jgi:hypothetical protein
VTVVAEEAHRGKITTRSPPCNACTAIGMKRNSNLNAATLCAAVARLVGEAEAD